jgi:hypothetical protein
LNKRDGAETFGRKPRKLVLSREMLKQLEQLQSLGRENCPDVQSDTMYSSPLPEIRRS